MSKLPILIGVATISLLLLLAVPWYVRRMARDAEAHALWQQRFFQALDRLIDNKDTPEKIIEIGLLFGYLMRNRTMLTGLLRAILFGNARNPLGWPALGLSSMPHRVAVDFSSLTVAWLHALSHMGVLRGMLLRNLMFPIFKKWDGIEASAEKVDEAVVRPYEETAISVAKHKGPRPLVPA